jgi:3-hydroxyacyl-[acyl-carrier-protein] dehydratase
MRNTLLENFYTELSSTWSAEKTEFVSVIKLNSAHPIFKGHFEQVPIAPGVCLIQIIKEILMEKLQKNLILTKGDNIKFLAMINPVETPELNISFIVKSTGDVLDTSAIYSNGTTSFVKFKGTFRVV